MTIWLWRNARKFYCSCPGVFLKLSSRKGTGGLGRRVDQDPLVMILLSPSGSGGVIEEMEVENEVFSDICSKSNVSESLNTWRSECRQNSKPPWNSHLCGL